MESFGIPCISFLKTDINIHIEITCYKYHDSFSILFFRSSSQCPLSCPFASLFDALFALKFTATFYKVLLLIVTFGIFQPRRAVLQSLSPCTHCISPMCSTSYFLKTMILFKFAKAL